MESNGEENRYAPPKAPVADIVPSSGAHPALATRNRRLAAGMIDGLSILLIMWILSRVTPWNPFIPPEASNLSFQLLSAVIGFISFLVIHGYLLWKRGQTVGKALMGTRIVRSDGSAVSFVRLVGLRYGIGSVMGLVPLASQIYALLDCALIFRKSRQCLHDQIADTIVIKLQA